MAGYPGKQGRKRISALGKLDRAFNVKLSQGHLDALRERATREQTSMTSTARSLIERGLGLPSSKPTTIHPPQSKR